MSTLDKMLESKSKMQMPGKLMVNNLAQVEALAAAEETKINILLRILGFSSLRRRRSRRKTVVTLSISLNVYSSSTRSTSRKKYSRTATSISLSVPKRAAQSM